MRLILNLVALCLLVGSFQSCVSKKKYEELMSAKEATDQALAETQAQVQTLEEEREELAADLEETKERLNGEIEEMRSDLNSTKSMMSEVERKLDLTEEELGAIVNNIESTFQTYESSGLSVEERDGKMYVMTKTPMRYRTGSAALSSDERAALAELAEVLKNNPDLNILVEGHADNQQYPAGSGYDNWDLSVSRAMGVVRQLIRDGVSPDQVGAVGYGDSRPTASNDSEDGRAENRRTVIHPEFNAGEILEQAKAAQQNMED